jgi:hypothetical protein
LLISVDRVTIYPYYLLIMQNLKALEEKRKWLNI